ncbi:MAG: hypothetical protein ABIG28_02970 [archaeon]
MFKKRVLMDEITEYLKRNLKKGYTRESLHFALLNQGYSKLTIEKAQKKVDEDLSHQAPLLKTKPTIKYEVVEPQPEKKKGFFGFFQK